MKKLISLKSDIWEAKVPEIKNPIYLKNLAVGDFLLVTCFASVVIVLTEYNWSVQTGQQMVTPIRILASHWTHPSCICTPHWLMSNICHLSAFSSSHQPPL